MSGFIRALRFIIFLILALAFLYATLHSPLAQPLSVAIKNLLPNHSGDKQAEILVYILFPLCALAAHGITKLLFGKWRK